MSTKPHIRPRLSVIGNRPVTLPPSLGDLRQHAAALFPGSAHLQSGWVRAKQIIKAKRPRVEIGGAHCDVSRTARTLREAGIQHLDETYEIPRFLLWRRT